mmetsp:Transcript_26811/g.67911  ORF Transcript_26811/g.67911 Transcript_26811/m.67911 type:complete len:595 (-) Transcript_26811:836-2620(-)
MAAASDDAFYAKSSRWDAGRQARLERLRADVQKSRAEFEASLHKPAVPERSAAILAETGYVDPVTGWEQAEEHWLAKKLASPARDTEATFAPQLNPYSRAIARSRADATAPTESFVRHVLAAEEAARPQPHREIGEDERTYVGEDLYARGLELRQRRQVHAEALRQEIDAAELRQAEMDPASRRLAQARPAGLHVSQPTRASLGWRHDADPTREQGGDKRTMIKKGQQWSEDGRRLSGGSQLGAEAGSTVGDGLGGPGESFHKRGAEYDRWKQQRQEAVRRAAHFREEEELSFFPVRVARYDPPPESRGTADGPAMYARAVQARERKEEELREARQLRELAELSEATFRPQLSRGSLGRTSSSERTRRRSDASSHADSGTCRAGTGRASCACASDFKFSASSGALHPPFPPDFKTGGTGAASAYCAPCRPPASCAQQAQQGAHGPASAPGAQRGAHGPASAAQAPSPSSERAPAGAQAAAGAVADDGGRGGTVRHGCCCHGAGRAQQGDDVRRGSARRSPARSLDLSRCSLSLPATPAPPPAPRAAPLSPTCRCALPLAAPTPNVTLTNMNMNINIKPLQLPSDCPLPLSAPHF